MATPQYNATFDLFKSSLGETTVVGIDWILPLLVIVITMLLITRDKEKWKVIAFPIAIMWQIAGLSVHLLVLLVTGLMFVISSLSSQIIGNVLGMARRVVSGQEARIIREREMTRAEKGLKLFKRKQRYTKEGAKTGYFGTEEENQYTERKRISDRKALKKELEKIRAKSFAFQTGAISTMEKKDKLSKKQRNQFEKDQAKYRKIKRKEEERSRKQFEKDQTKYREIKRKEEERSRKQFESSQQKSWRRKQLESDKWKTQQAKARKTKLRDNLKMKRDMSIARMETRLAGLQRKIDSGFALEEDKQILLGLMKKINKAKKRR